VTALVHREPNRRYTLNISPIVPSAPDQEVSNQCLHLLEKAIFETPEQWYQWKEFGKVISALPDWIIPARDLVKLPQQVGVSRYAHA
jgi:KDO2-lipid IV(A) lauroyltransferase